MESTDKGMALNMDVGKRLRLLREERNVSMRALARQSGLSANALSMIERGLTSPSVSTLTKLAEALEVPITAFFRTEPSKQDIVHRKSDERRSVTFPDGVWEGLGGEIFSGKLEAFMLTLNPEGSSGPHGMLHTGHEFVYCLEGEIEYEVNNQIFHLKTGDNLIFAAKMQHKWRNPSKAQSIAIIIISGFQENERPSEFHLASGQAKNNGTDDE